MINFSKNNIKLWSNIGMRSTFGVVINSLAESYKNFLVVTGDVSTSAGLDKFKNNYKNRYLDVGIAEQNMIGVAAGLTASGKKVFTTTFSPFQTLRCCEQIKVNLSYMKFDVCMVGLASGISLGSLGYTHCSIEDVGVLRSMPNLTIIAPCDTTELAKSVKEILTYNKPVYLRLTGNNKVSLINNKNYNFKIGKANKIINGKNIAILSTGTIISECVDAIKSLNLGNLKPSLYNFHTIKPIDKRLVNKISENYKFIFTVEEHNIIGGLGSAVSETLSNKKRNCFHIKIGINDEFTKCGDYSFMKKVNNLDHFSIAKKIKKYVSKSR